MDGIGKHLNAILFQRGIPKKQFSKQIGLSEQQLHAILSGNSLSTLETLEKISTALDVPTDFFLQDYGKQFLIFAIDDYFSKVDKSVAQATLDDLSYLLNEENSDG